MEQKRPREAWRGWFSLIFLPVLSVGMLWHSYALFQDGELLTMRGGFPVPPLLLVALAGVFGFVAIRILTAEKHRWPVGFEPGALAKISRVALIVALIALGVASALSAIAQAGIVGWS